ncbi:unnamed protein product [Musa acuminata subsp. malaccensis]|uniref:(wild Malaysian banana) hypothetical protein n=1 Tax=Musa acuminata subsp. malaccensis TaxID=214687 RepID=A0A804L4P4_MUSAM|nr:PREDICTED: microtubule-binding protein TANGLED1 [Musa acuminata subsp. malaccensis]CAG1863679.1 unnamed protein product [Musa acuminata subsp. malaccensis]
MVAKTPPKERRMAAALNPNLVRETLIKVERCMARLQELQCTVTGGTKVVAGVTLSPRSTRGYLRTSLVCKKESLRMRNNASSRRSPAGKFQGSTNGEWRRMSLPAMLLGETVVEILEASRTTKEAVTAAAAAAMRSRHKTTEPTTPITARRTNKSSSRENTEMQARRVKEKQGRLRIIRSEQSPAVSRARSRIRFKSNSPLATAREEQMVGGRPSVAAHRVSPRNRPWAKKTVLFPNPLFTSSSPTSCHGQRRFYKTRSPVIGRTRPSQSPHKFVIKSPSSTSLKSQFAPKKAVTVRILKSSPEKVVVLKKSRRCSFSPSKLVNRIIASPIKTRPISLLRSSTGLVAGLKQRSGFSTPVRISSSIARI